MTEKRWDEMHSKRITITLEDFEIAEAKVLTKITSTASGMSGTIIAMSIIPFCGGAGAPAVRAGALRGRGQG